MLNHNANVTLVVVLSGLASSAAMGQLSIDSYVIAGGGVSSATGGGLTLSATFGQPVVGTLLGPDLTLYSGFWSPLGGSACDPDLNQDGNPDQGDIDYLVNVVAGGANPTNIDPDFNQDGNIDQGDVDSLINVVAGGACP
ncbi:MAG: hypothetical protein WC718_02920 [Phycisphaerales bacterium]|jgi:hypothetical protein